MHRCSMWVVAGLLVGCGGGKPQAYVDGVEAMDEALSKGGLPTKASCAAFSAGIDALGADGKVAPATLQQVRTLAGGIQNGMCGPAPPAGSEGLRDTWVRVKTGIDAALSGSAAPEEQPASSGPLPETVTRAIAVVDEAFAAGDPGSVGRALGTLQAALKDAATKPAAGAHGQRWMTIAEGDIMRLQMELPPGGADLQAGKLQKAASTWSGIKGRLAGP